MGRLLAAACFTALVAGCVTSASHGVVMVAPNTYVIGGNNGDTSLPPKELKAARLRQAAEFCQEQGRQMQPIASVARDAAVGAYASADVQFRCLSGN